MKTLEIIEKLRELSNPDNVHGMKRFGIAANNAFGVKTDDIKAIAKQAGKNQALAEELWETGYHEARLLAAYVAEPKIIDSETADKWVHEIDSWDICDNLIGKLLWKIPLAYEKAVSWQAIEKEYDRRSGFVMMCMLAVHDKKSPDENFIHFFDFIIDKAADERNFVKKAVNWALRQLGKRSFYLNCKSLEAASKILEVYPDSRSANWIAKDALRELSSEKVKERISKVK